MKNKNIFTQFKRCILLTLLFVGYMGFAQTPSCDNLYLISESRNAIYDISSLSGGSLTSTSTNKVMNVSTGANASLAVGIDPNGSGQNIWVTTKNSSSGYVYVNNTATSVTSPGYGGLTANPVDGKVYSVKGGATNARKLYQVYPSYQDLGTITGDTFFHSSSTYISTDSFFDTNGKYYLIAYSAVLDTSTNTYISTTKRLYSIDLNTRKATFVRAITGIPSSVNAIQGLAFYNDKIYLLYQSSTSTNARLYEINPDTGAGSLKTTYVYPTGGDMDLASCQVYNPPHTVGAPPVQNLANDCPLTTVNLEDAHTGTTPSGSELRWFTNNTHTGTALTAAQIATAGAGTYYAFYYDSNGVYSPASVAVTVTIDDCPDCTNSGETSVNLNSMYTGTFPTGVELQWWTTPDRQAGTQVADPTNVTVSGTYYAFFHDTVNNCYNTDNSTAFVNVTILPPCDTTCTQPGDFTANGIPTKVGITVQQKQDNWPANIPNGFIALESKEKGFVITRVPHVGGTTGSPDFDDAIEEPREGMLVYDIQDKCVKLFNGEKWKCIEKSCNTAEFTLNCSDLVISGDTQGPDINFTITLPYSNGDGATYAQQIMNSIDSLGLSGLTASLSAGTLANGSGEFIITVSGTVDNGGAAYFQFELNGHSCLIVSQITMDAQGV
ncbi:hypothetical protein [Chryseobacterium oryctis]|uniref:Ig-like domain-containing protein n=1 Tax=Chryseobacterium oryctis TaxID=2952618 RepID=A0ABT3HNH1_9FLAO|nr:hypothetical protein [Chryseobacterium oryctis]MCW3161325.1 hypothetical protein [Chryseobacterium oryctis]